MPEDIDIMISELLREGKELQEEGLRMALLAVLNDLSENGKKDVTITELWLKLHPLKLEALQIEKMLDYMGFKVREIPSELSIFSLSSIAAGREPQNTPVRVVQANSSLLEEWVKKSWSTEKKTELLRKAEERIRLRQEGVEPLKHTPRWHYKVVLDMLDRVSKHGKKDIDFFDYKNKLDWILKLDSSELQGMLSELGFRIKTCLFVTLSINPRVATEIIEANASLLKEWKSKKMKWWEKD